MRVGRHYWMVLGWAVCLGWACSEKPEGSDAALYGVGNLVSAGDLVFTLSRDRNELRALDLNSSGRVRGPHFVPAVNPLEPLSIPVLPYPNILASDLSWEDELLDTGGRIPQGKAVGGPFVYAASHGREGISIVGASREWLKELQRISTSAPVTALAAHRGAHSTLFFATYDGSEGSLWAMELEDEQAVKEASPEVLLASQRRIRSYAGQAITALSVLPQGALAVALRDTHGGASGGVAALHISDDTQSTWREIPLPQALRMLATHAGADCEGGPLPAGKWLYGILDEGGCGGDFCTGGGVVAVDIEALGVVKTIPSIGGMPTSLGFIPLTHQGVEVLVGFYITGRGLIGVFNAGVPGPLEAAKAVSVAFFSLNGEGELVEASYVEGPLRNEDGTPAVVVVGEVLDETILIGIEALLPGWIRTTLEADPAVAGRFWVGGDADMSRIRPGDLLEVFVGEALCTKLNVAGIDEGGGALELEGEFPACFSERTHFQLRAGSGSRQPYVVTGTQTGYMGRVGPKEAFEHTFSAGASINIGFGDGILSGAGQGARWELALASGYLGHSYDIQGVSPCSTRIAAGVWMDSVRKKAYISFSSSNALVEVGVKALLEGGLGEGEVACYR